MDMDSDFFELPSPIFVQYCCWPITNYSFIPNKRPTQDVLVISAPQLPPKGIRAEKQCWKCFRPECEGSRAKRYCKNPCDGCNRVDCDGRDSRTTRPCQNKIDSPDVGGDGRMGQ